MKKHFTKAQPNPATAQDQPGFAIVQTITRTELTTFVFSESGPRRSVGKIIDDMILAAMERGDSITELTFRISEGDWSTWQKLYDEAGVYDTGITDTIDVAHAHPKGWEVAG